MLFASREDRIGTVFPNTDRPKLVNDIFIFLKTYRNSFRKNPNRCNANNRERLHCNIFTSITIKDRRGFASAHYVNGEESNRKFKLSILNL